MSNKTIIFIILTLAIVFVVNRKDKADTYERAVSVQASREDSPSEGIKEKSYTSPSSEEINKTQSKISHLKRIKDLVNSLYIKNLEFVQSDPILELNAEIDNEDLPEIKELLMQERDWMIVRCGAKFMYYKDCTDNYEIVSYKEKLKMQLESNYRNYCAEARDEQCLQIEDQLARLEYEVPSEIEYSYHNFNNELSSILSSYLE